ncbi:hypothetical protein GH714_008099 [Hevea brasiliensis]|uniref:Uncharacterized protein n=1 Tax=Hevea brasiliensis TaxID=3981 RepID=A0A6A6L9C8_HEVBR|nr:hypothetical protein GH714_008099 [Hevea brasiliensis]
MLDFSRFNGDELETWLVKVEYFFEMQNQNFAAEVFVLPLDNYDLTLGEEWLATLGDMRLYHLLNPEWFQELKQKKKGKMQAHMTVQDSPDEPIVEWGKDFSSTVHQEVTKYMENKVNGEETCPNFARYAITSHKLPSLSTPTSTPIPIPQHDYHSPIIPTPSCQISPSHSTSSPSQNEPSDLPSPLAVSTAPPTMTKDFVSVIPPTRKSNRVIGKPTWLRDFVDNVQSCNFLHHSNSTSTSISSLVPMSTTGNDFITSQFTPFTFNSEYLHFLANVSVIHEPTSYTQAKNDPHWVEVMNKELAALEHNGT